MEAPAVPDAPRETPPEPTVGDVYIEGTTGDRWELVRGVTDRRGRWLLFAVFHVCDNPECSEPALTSAALDPGQWPEYVEAWQLVRAPA